MKKILVVGANAAWQKTLSFEKFCRDAVNRASKMCCFASGKGINCCRAASVYGKVEPLLVQFSGGENGEKICRYLSEEQISFINIPTANPTRCCLTALDTSDRSMTELIEPSYPVSESETEAMLSAVKDTLDDCGAAAICGTLPDGTDPALYLSLGELVAARGVPLLLDAFKNILPLLDLPELMLKINRQELSALTGTSGVVEGLKKLFALHKLKLAAITDGAGNAFLSDGRKWWQFQLPHLPDVVNPIGCGDTASGVWLSEICCGRMPEEAFRMALGCASANAATILPGSFDFGQAMDLASRIVVTEHEFC